jgi:hypothetical protein
MCRIATEDLSNSTCRFDRGLGSAIGPRTAPRRQRDISAWSRPAADRGKAGPTWAELYSRVRPSSWADAFSQRTVPRRVWGTPTAARWPPAKRGTRPAAASGPGSGPTSRVSYLDTA